MRAEAILEDDNDEEYVVIRLAHLIFTEVVAIGFRTLRDRIEQKPHSPIPALDQSSWEATQFRPSRRSGSDTQKVEGKTFYPILPPTLPPIREALRRIGRTNQNYGEAFGRCMIDS